MLDILSKVFGPHRAVSIFVFMQTRGLAVLLAIAFVAVVSSLLFFNRPREHEPVAFMTLPVITAFPVGKDFSTGVIATLRLPDGQSIRVTSTEGPIAKAVTATACVEKRRFVDNGEFRYRLKLPRDCGS
jgi:hypothetical protein